ncbi:MAG: ABC transporter permease subunit [Planctomycetes bacterium]|nr:ABC transporter permease subunit [Planctomycetota bacterium]
MSPVLLRFLWRRHRTGSLLFGLAPLMVGLIIGLIYPTYAQERALVEVFKHSLRFFGHEQLDMFSPRGSFSLVFQDPLILLCYAILPALAPIALYAGDRARGALDLVLATPLDRAVLLRSLALFQFLQGLWFALMALASAWLGALVAGEAGGLPFGTFLPLALVAAGVTAAFGGLAALISVRAPSRAAAGTAYGSLVFVLMALDTTARMWKGGSFLGWLTPLGYLRPALLLSGEASWPLRVAYFVVPPIMALLSWWATVVVHRRRASA